MAATELLKTVLFNNPNLKAYYMFESGALTTDSSGNSRTLTNTDVTETTGVFGGGGAFNGTSSKLQLPTPSDLGSITGLTYSVWINAFNKDYGPDDGKIIDIRGATHYAILLATSTKFQFIINSGSATTIETNEITGSWIHLVGTYDGATMRLFVNGSQVASSAKTGTLTINATGMIGQEHNNGVARYFQGSMDDVAIFSTALSADQIKELYEGRFIGESWPQSGLVAGYHLSSETDFSGNSYHLTNTGTTTFSAGKFGNCAVFNGSSQKLISASKVINVSPASACSATAWFKPNNTGNESMIVQSYSSANARELCIQMKTSTTVRGYVWGGSATLYEVVSGAISATGVWYFAAVTKDTSDVLRFYLNGNLVGSIQCSENAGSVATNGIGIGGHANFPANYLTGAIDEVLIFNRALTPQEIRRMYALGVGKLQ